MDKLLDFLIKNITGIDDVEINKHEEDDRITYVIIPPKDTAGMIIGKQGKIIKTIIKIMKVRATLDKKIINIEVLPKEETNQN